MPAGAERMEPLPVYSQWWKMTEECSALGGDYSRIAWYVVPNVESISFRGMHNKQGIWLDGDRIVLAGKSVRDGMLVRHEMLHALLKKTKHPRGDFVGRCGGVVTCEGQCLSEGNAPRDDPRAVTVNPVALEISVRTWPESPGSDLLGGYMRFTVHARNPNNFPVIVQLPAAGDDGPSVTFRYRCSGPGTYRWLDSRAWAPEVTRFKAGETKKMVYDIWIGGSEYQNRLPTGTYRFRGAYGDHWSSPASVTIRP